MSKLDNMKRDDDSETLCKLSYVSFIELVTALSLELRSLILRTMAKDVRMECENMRMSSVPIAVSIPEGPFLPLAVAAVHALNVPFSTHRGVELSAVLVPLDPTDGRDRLFRMLCDVRPAIILTASDDDLQRMQDIAAEVNAVTHVAMRDNILRSSDLQVIDIRKLHQEALSYASESFRLALLHTVQRCQLSDSLQDMLCTCIYDVLNKFSPCDDEVRNINRISHIVFTSGSTGQPKGCLSSSRSLRCYIESKNCGHAITADSTVLLASALSFDPCLSDILATLTARGTLALAPRGDLLHKLRQVLRFLSVSHVLCTPTLWSAVQTGTERPCEDYPLLRVVALGGEPIPTPVLRAWARPSENGYGTLRLCATFGVTEACVYQTFCEVFWDGITAFGSNVGLPFSGTGIRICQESSQDALIDVVAIGSSFGIGEVVLHGNQIDNLSSYLLRPDLTATKFIKECATCHYRTGDRGYVDQQTSHLHILGRLAGEDGMVKVNGVRVELGEVEAALVDDRYEFSVVLDAIVTADQPVNAAASSFALMLHAFVVLSDFCLKEMGFVMDVPESGLVCTEAPLLTLLRARCLAKARAVPAVFVVIPRIPLSPTGKRYRRGVPSIDDALPLATSLQLDSGRPSSIPLREYGRTGQMVAQEISECLNLRPSQETLLSTTATFAMLGGDSLTATRVGRAIYARHNNVLDSRLIGGKYGVLEGPFAVVHLLSADNLGAYVDWLDTHGVRGSQYGAWEKPPLLLAKPGDDQLAIGEVPMSKDIRDVESKRLFDALLQATSSGHTNVAMALLDAGADPNLDESGCRLGKTSGRNERKKSFRSSPLHLACLRGIPSLVKKLLDKKAKYNTPNASSTFPIHLAASGESHAASTDDEDESRLLCVKYLLEAGSPLSVRDGSKQSILHAAARAGHVKLLRFALMQWAEQDGASPGPDSSLDWRDSWMRTPVHWAVLNGKADALAILIENGSSANPYQPKPNHRRTSVAAESPMEMCTRLYREDTVLGRRIAGILRGQDASSA